MGSSPSMQSKKFTSIIPVVTSPTSSSSSGSLSDCTGSDGKGRGRRSSQSTLTRSGTFFIEPFHAASAAGTGRSSLPCVKLEPIDDRKLSQRKIGSSGRSRSTDVSERVTRSRKRLPPITRVPGSGISDHQQHQYQLEPEHESLPFSEYKRWLANFRRHSAVTLTPVKPLNQVRCQTATLRLRKRCSKSLKPLSPRPRIFTVSGKTPDANILMPDPVFHIRDHEAGDGRSGIFDLKALNDALTKPRNKVVPMRQPAPRPRIATIAH